MSGFAGLEDAAAAQELCKVVLVTLREYTDKPSCRAVGTDG